MGENRVDAASQDRTQWLASVGMDPKEVLGRQLNGCQWILDLVGHLSSHVGPGLETVRLLELNLLVLQIDGHLIE